MRKTYLLLPFFLIVFVIYATAADMPQQVAQSPEIPEVSINEKAPEQAAKTAPASQNTTDFMASSPLAPAASDEAEELVVTEIRDDQGNLIAREHRNGEGKLRKKEEYINNKKIREYFYDENERLEKGIMFLINGPAEGKPIFVVHFSSGEMTSYDQYAYFDNGSLQTVTTRDANYTVQNIKHYYQSMDPQVDLLEAELEYVDGVIVREHQYYNNGNYWATFNYEGGLITEALYYNVFGQEENGRILVRRETFYDHDVERPREIQILTEHATFRHSYKPYGVDPDRKSPYTKPWGFGYPYAPYLIPRYPSSIAFIAGSLEGDAANEIMDIVVSVDETSGNIGQIVWIVKSTRLPAEIFTFDTKTKFVKRQEIWNPGTKPIRWDETISKGGCRGYQTMVTFYADPGKLGAVWDYNPEFNAQIHTLTTFYSFTNWSQVEAYKIIYDFESGEATGNVDRRLSVEEFETRYGRLI